MYQNDIITFGETLQERHERLREIFERLRNFNLKIEPDKCEFLKTELSYIRQIVTSEGVKADHLKVKTINGFPTPRNTTDVKSFLGLAGYYRKFIPQLSKIAKPLNDQLKKRQQMAMGTRTYRFHLLQTILTQEPVLQIQTLRTHLY